jgi:hypothetical protein
MALLLPQGRTKRQMAPKSQAERAQLLTQALHRGLDGELVPDPLFQIYQAPAHHAVVRRLRAVLDHPC